MSEQNTGGPAFPHVWTDTGALAEIATGMTLRDFFAATVDIPWERAFERAFDKKPAANSLDAIGAREVIAARVELRYMEADAMLKARDA